MISQNFSLRQSGGRQHGVALVIVLAMLVLMSALVIGFMNSATTETVASKTFANGVEARQAAEVAVNFVIGQIREATEKEGDNLTWVSQPGAIRTIGSGAGSSQVYKLYSSDKMQVSQSQYKPLDDLKGESDDAINRENPSKLPAGFVDLNAPVFAPAPGKSSGDARYEARYPIVNPYAMQQINQSSGKFVAARGPGEGVVEGFYCDSIIDPSHKDIDGKPIPLVPMPVKWLYTLKDGTITSTAAGKIIGATKDNPPISRSAFWTDDESCKINLNTATEPTYWDTPVVSTLQEAGDFSGGQVTTRYPTSKSLNLAVGQPTRNEYQRYPGHPATTALSPAIRWMFDKYVYPAPRYSDGNYGSYMVNENLFKEAVYRLAPRVVGGTGTSEGGQKINEYINRAVMNGLKVEDKDRLFATVDEYFFRPDRTGRDAATYRKVDYGNSGGDPEVKLFTPGNLEKLRFFLTASSRSPELNSFGRPRITIWPIHQDAAKRTTSDELFAFTSTLGGKAYYFVRKDPTSATVDALLPAADGQSNPGRTNMMNYAYLQNITGKQIPWIGSSFLEKYGVNRDQILTEIWDYIRCTNLVDTSETRSGAGQAAFTKYFWSGNQEGSAPNAGSGQVIPLRVQSTTNTTTKGFGRFVTLSEVDLLVFRNGSATAPARAVLLFDMYTLSQGYPGLMENYSMRVRNADKLLYVDPANSTKDGKSLGFPNDAVNMITVDAYSGPNGRFFMPSRSFGNQFLWFPDPPTSWTTSLKTFPADAASPNFTVLYNAGQRSVYPFISNTFPIPTSGFFGFRHKADIGTDKQKSEDALITVDLYAELTPTTNSIPIQTFHIRFPDNTGTGDPKVPGTGFTKLPVPTNTTAFTSRISNSRGTYNWIDAGDVVRGMEIGALGSPTAITKESLQGDLRISGGRASVSKTGKGGEDVPSDYFMRRGELSTQKPYENSGIKAVHGLRSSHGEFMTGLSKNIVTDDGKLAKNGTAGRDNNNTGGDRWPKLPSGINGVLNSRGQPGDWDRGMSKFVDGPWINKPDEGNVEFGDPSGAPPYFRGGGGYEELGNSYFTPSRMIASAVSFGSLPTRVLGTNPVPWETLLFRPPILSGGQPDHPGFLNPPDHYLLDLFNMPVVEPYAISEPFSTAGKININTEIAPFGYLKTNVGGTNYGYIDRKTGLYAVLKDIKMLFVPDTAPDGAHSEKPRERPEIYRYDIDRKLTITEMQKRIDTQGLFRTASEICEVNLYPDAAIQLAPKDSTGWQVFWAKYNQTGDNGRERPYAVIYPRITTRSNVFTVYTRAQSIRKSPNTPVDEFDEGRDQVTGEYRGSSVIERFLDPNDPALVRANYDPTSTKGEPLASYYRFRVINTKRFTGN